MSDWIGATEIGGTIRTKLNSIPNDGSVAAVATMAQGTKADTAVQPGDLGTASALNVGINANEIIQLDGSALLPAVDGSQLTNLPAGQLGSTVSWAAGTNVDLIVTDGPDGGGSIYITNANGGSGASPGDGGGTVIRGGNGGTQNVDGLGANGANADDQQIISGNGGDAENTDGGGGNGGGTALTAGNGGIAHGTSGGNRGGSGGQVVFSSGNGGAGGTQGGVGGQIVVNPGTGGAATSGDSNGGDGGDFIINLAIATGGGASGAGAPGRNGQFIIDGCPTSDPHVLGALWADAGASFILKVSQG